MITAQIPMTIKASSTALSIDEFIEYTIKNDLNIVTTKWLAHTRNIAISDARNALNAYWEITGKAKGYCATFSVLAGSSDQTGFQIKLVDNEGLDKLCENEKVLSVEIYAVHAVPLKDRKVQLGMINVPIYDVIGEIEAPGIDSSSIKIIHPIHPPSAAVVVEETVDNHLASAAEHLQVVENPQITISNRVDESSSQPPNKKMKLVKKTRTFMQNGYEMVEHYNEMVPCEEEEDELSETVSAKQSAAAPPQTKSKQSSMMSFFKKK